ncbi:diuretic hormone class 2 [Chelonus insularis]|uniref:diuretic hormone class 2 n=1 Tax=Chelonus insularis TaxID=460826 RepID=UPI00158EE8A7|nr:diuretic hormone class 2 [Chelonus insularis]
MQKNVVMIWMTVCVIAVIITASQAAPYSQERQIYLDQLENDPEAFYELISQYNKLRELENTKRAYGLDFGLSRGFSGSQTAKHLMGMAAANYANGPGRKRRSEQP